MTEEKFKLATDLRKLIYDDQYLLKEMQKFCEDSRGREFTYYLKAENVNSQRTFKLSGFLAKDTLIKRMKELESKIIINEIKLREL